MLGHFHVVKFCVHFQIVVLLMKHASLTGGSSACDLLQLPSHAGYLGS